MLARRVKASIAPSSAPSISTTLSPEGDFGSSSSSPLSPLLRLVSAAWRLFHHPDINSNTVILLNAFISANVRYLARSCPFSCKMGEDGASSGVGPYSTICSTGDWGTGSRVEDARLDDWLGRGGFWDREREIFRVRDLCRQNRPCSMITLQFLIGDRLCLYGRPDKSVNAMPNLIHDHLTK